MAFAVSEGKLRAVHKPVYQAPTSVRLTDDLTQDYATIYRKQPHVRTVVEFLARNIAQLSIHTFRRISDTDRERVLDHPLATLLAKPNGSTTAYRLIHALVSDRGIYDRALWIKSTKSDGTLELVRVPPRLWTIDDDDSWIAPAAFIVKGSRGKMKIAAENAVYFRGYNPQDERYGLSPIETLRRALSEEHSAGEMREQIMRNGARHSGYISRPIEAKWDEAARQRFKSGWRQQYSGWSASQAGGTPVLEDGMTFTAASQSAADLQYIEARKLTREEVAAAYFIPPPMIGILDNASFSNISEQHKMLYQDTLGPLLMEIKQEIEMQILPEFDDREGVYIEFNMAEKLRGSFEEQAAQLQTSVGAPFLTRNEARARANLPRVDGGDELVTPLNVLVGGQASPRDGQTAGGGGRGVDATVADAAVESGLVPSDVVALVNAATALIRAGFDPGESLAAVGLDPVKHLGLLPITIQKPVEPEGDVDESLVDDIAKGQPARVKSPGVLRAKDAENGQRVAKVEEVVRAFLDRQSVSVLSALGAKADADWWDEDRWNDELASDLFKLAMSVTAQIGADTAELMGFAPDAYDPARTEAFLLEVAKSRAGAINSATRDQIEKVLGGETTDTVETPADVFEKATTSRLAVIAGTLTTTFAAFATVEAARQTTTGATKTWHVNSTNPRPAHARMDGETVGVDEKFSNGANWPGDPALGVDGVAGCSCDVEVTFA